MYPVENVRDLGVMVSSDEVILENEVLWGLVYAIASLALVT